MTQTRVALIGAGGKMGTRIFNNLINHEAYDLICVEQGEAGIARLRERGVEPVPAAEAVAQAEFVIFAVPDVLMKTVTTAVVPHVPAGAVVILLDPAAAAAGEMYLRDDVNYVISHPCHPPLFGDQPKDLSQRDFFGGVSVIQDIVTALMQGPEEIYAQADELCKAMYAPVETSHRITVEQMAVLEPAMAEVVAATAVSLVRDALEEAVKAGVPREAATAFMLGHAQIAFAITFGIIPSPFSDAAKVAIKWGTERIIRPDWRQVFESDQIKEQIKVMLHPELMK